MKRQQIAARAYRAIQESCAALTDRQIAAVLVEGRFWSYDLADERQYETAKARARACRSPHKRDVFTAGELLALQAETGCWAWLEFEAELAGREVRALTREGAMTEIADGLNTLLKVSQSQLGAINALAVRLERLDGGVHAETAHEQPADNVVRFSRP